MGSPRYKIGTSPVRGNLASVRVVIWGTLDLELGLLALHLSSVINSTFLDTVY